MNFFRHQLPMVIAIFFGVTTLLGLLFAPGFSQQILVWAAFLAALALVLGAVNLLTVHARRLFKGNLYSGVLVLSMLAVFALAVTDGLGITSNGLENAFVLVQQPLEAALAALLAFFLLFAGVRLLQRQRSIWGGLFLLSALLMLLTRLPLPGIAGLWFERVRAFIANIVVIAGMRGLLIGVALGVILVSLRLLSGLERPYNK